MAEAQQRFKLDTKKVNLTKVVNAAVAKNRFDCKTCATKRLMK